MASQDVLFTFTPGDKVETPHGETGFVEISAYTDGGVVKYYVSLPGGKGHWFVEAALKALGE